MKNPQPIQPIAERFPALEEQEVAFAFCAPEAHRVEVAGAPSTAGTRRRIRLSQPEPATGPPG